MCLKESGTVYDFLPGSKTRNKVFPLVVYIYCTFTLIFTKLEAFNARIYIYIYIYIAWGL